MIATLLLFAQLLYWEQGPSTAQELRRHGVTRIAVPAAQAAGWQKTGLQVVPVSAEALRARVELDPPGVDIDIAVASPTQRPWVVAAGWRFLREGAVPYLYKVPAGRAPLAAAEAHVWGADALLAIDARDLADVARVLARLADAPASPWQDLAQIEVVDDRSEDAGEVMNLLSRRNLLWRRRPPPAGAPAAGPRPPVVIELGTAAYPRALAKDPSELANKVRQHIGDPRRLLRVYGSEVVLARLQGAGGQLRLSLLNYGNGVREGVRVRLRGVFGHATAATDRAPAQPPADPQITGGATELTVPPFALWAVVDLRP